MKLTALGCEKDPTKDSRLACHLLELCQTRVLLECPLDLSALSLFLPAFLSTHPINPAPAAPVGTTSDTPVNGQIVSKRLRNGNVNSSFQAKAGFKRGRQKDVPEDAFPEDASWMPSSSAKKIRVNDDQHGAEEAGENGRNGGKGYGELSSAFKEVNGQVFVDGEPWYKTAELGLVDVGLLDAVIISNPSGMLGLPFLTKHPDFCGKVYATKATAEIGKMMMEELVSMHAEFVQSHGRPRAWQTPPWLNLSALGTLPVGLRNSHLSRCLSSRANWQPLYSAADIGDCMVQVKKLRFGEEVNVDGCLTISPSSSGLGIGTSNWFISGPRRSVGYIAASLATKNYAMPLDMASLAGSHTLVFSDVECPHETLKIMEKKATVERDIKVEKDVKAREVLQPESGVPGVEHGVPARQSSTGSGSSQRLTTTTSGSFSSGAARAGQSSGSVGAAKPGALGQPTGVLNEKGGKGGSGELGGPLRNDVASVDLRPEVGSICKATVEAIRRGGSVLVPVSPVGILLELLDELAVQLGAANLTHIPIYYITPAAEEMLAYGNTVPEWLCPARQEKLYAGESLFGYVDLVQEERLRHFKALSSPDLQRVWQEPCIVFAAHWSLRMGPAVHLLHRWRQSPLCLLILTEGKPELELLLAPFQPLALQVLEVPVAGRLRPKEVSSVMQRVKPDVILVPESLFSALEGTPNPSVRSTLSYKKGQTIQIPNFENELEVDMSAELAIQVQPKLVKPRKVAAALLRADLCIRDGKLSLRTPISSDLPTDVLAKSRHYEYRWGQVNVDALLAALQDRGVYDVYLRETARDDSSMLSEGFDDEVLGSESKAIMVEVRTPSQAWIEIGPNSSHIKANEASLRSLLADAVHSVLQVL